MQCERCTAQLPEYVDGTLPPQATAQVEQHLRDCVVCRAQLAEWQQVRAAVSAAPLPGAGPEAPHWDVFEARVLAHVRDARPRRFTAWLAPVGLAAAVAALVLLLGRAATDLPKVDGGLTVAAGDLNAAEIEQWSGNVDLPWDADWQWGIDATLADMDDDALEELPVLLAEALEVNTSVADWNMDILLPNETDAWLDEFETLDAEMFESFVTQLEQPMTS